MGDHVEALATQQKAVLMSERVNGIDHPYTITEYVSIVWMKCHLLSYGTAYQNIGLYIENLTWLGIIKNDVLSDSFGFIFICQWSSFSIIKTFVQSSISRIARMWRRSSRSGVTRCKYFV
jgi:hypothetical protein